MSNDTRLAILETTILNINSVLFDIKHDVKHLSERMDNRFDALDKKFESKFDTLNNRIWSNFLWLVGMMIGLAGLIAHTQHWI